MQRSHRYDLTVEWTGNGGAGTASYRSYSRANTVDAKGRPTIWGTADPAFLGDASRWNPEQLLVASISQCHLLWYLHLAVEAGIVVTSYIDRPVGTMTENDDGSGQFDEVTLFPEVTITAAARVEDANQLHERIAEKCFIARSVSFPIRHEPSTQISEELAG